MSGKKLFVIVILIAACTGCADGVSAERRYTGTLTGCGAPLPATLNRLGDGFAFTPGNGALTLRGTVAPDGGLRGALNTQPAGRPPYLLALTGRIDAAAVALRYTTPHCTATGSLAVVPVSLLP